MFHYTPLFNVNQILEKCRLPAHDVVDRPVIVGQQANNGLLIVTWDQQVPVRMCVVRSSTVMCVWCVAVVCARLSLVFLVRATFSLN